jgi:hypothetical protein
MKTSQQKTFNTNLMKVLIELYSDKKVVQFLTMKLTGFTNKEIQKELDLSPSSFSSYNNQYKDVLQALK